MRELFADPPSEFRPAPFWFWNARLDAVEIERQIREMHAKGVGGFFIHGRFGLETDYLSPEWMELVEHAVRVAKELGMQVWLYDENPFPSGVCGGVIMRNRDYWCKYLDLTCRVLSGGERAEISIPEGETVAAVAVDLSQGARTLNLMEEIQGGRLNWSAPDGLWEVMIFVERLAECPDFIYGSEPDYFEPGMVTEWFSYTHGAYARWLGRFFGCGIEGIFTDEPKMQCIYHMHEDAFTTAWFRGLPEAFQKRYGYDIVLLLPSLFRDFGEDPWRVRRDFWRLLAEEYGRRLFKPYHEWCRQHNLKLTGHLFLEEGLYANTMYQGNFMEEMEWFDMPGTDHLGLVTESEYGIRIVPKSITRVHGQKVVSSSAHIYGRPRVLSETFGCAGWELTMAHMKWIVDWQFSLGINFLCPHAFYYSIAGVRKTDAPPSQFYQACFWEHYRIFADYVSRLCFMLSKGRHKAQIALLYPIEGFHSEWAVGTCGPIDGFIAECYDFYCANLVKQHFDYDIVTERAIQFAEVAGGKLRVAGEEYELLILPPVTAMHRATLKKIQEFVREGGRVIGTGLLPVWDASESLREDVTGIVREVFQEDPIGLRRRFLESADQERDSTFSIVSEGRVGFISCNRAHLIGAVLREAVESLIEPEIRITVNGRECESVSAIHQTCEIGEMYFFANTTSEAVRAHISVVADGVPQVWDAETGIISNIGEFQQRGERIELSWEFEAYGSLLLVVGPHEEETKHPQLRATSLPPIPLGRKWRFRTESPNVLILRDWDFTVGVRADCSVYEYKTQVEALFVPEEVFLLLDDLRPGRHTQGSSIEVEVNGFLIQPPEDFGWAVDINFSKFDISGRLVEGNNQIVIRINHGGWAGPPRLMAAPQYLIGEFSLDENLSLRPPRTELFTGSWTEQGYPFYSGKGIYSQVVEIPTEYIQDGLCIEVEQPADMIEVWVNGTRAGVRPWPPYRVEVGSYVRAGENDLEIRVINSLANMLKSVKHPSGLLGDVRLVLC